MQKETDLDLQPLEYEEIILKLHQFPGWELNHDKITKTFEFPSFSTGIELLSKLAPFCDQIDHHPDIHIYYKKIQFDLTRFSIGDKVTDRDFTVAHKIEELFKESLT